MSLIIKIPEFLALITAFIITIIGIINRTSFNYICVEVCVVAVIFYVIGIFARYIIENMVNNINLKEETDTKEEKKPEYEAAELSESELEELMSEPVDIPELEMNGDVELADLDFEPLNLKRISKEDAVNAFNTFKYEE